mgnify:FL=1
MYIVTSLLLHRRTAKVIGNDFQWSLKKTSKKTHTQENNDHQH